MKAIFLALALAACQGAQYKVQETVVEPEIDFGPTVEVGHPFVGHVLCEYGRGSAFKLRSGRWVTVAHVSVNGGCTLNGRRIYVEHVRGDFAIIDIGDPPGDGLDINCDGFRDGQWYWGVGYGKGRLQSKAVRYSLIKSLIEPEFAALEYNRFVPGMSGGPVLDGNGRAVGTVNAYGIKSRESYSHPLKNTILCGVR